MKQLFFKSLLLAAFLPVFFISSCKKDDDKNNTTIGGSFNSRTPIDDPDVETKDLNVIINTNRSSFWLDTSINVSDFNIKIGLYIYNYTYATGSYKDISVYFNYASNVYLQNEIAQFMDKTSASSREFFLPTYLSGFKILSSMSTWDPSFNGTNSSGKIYGKNDEQHFGINGSGDRYIAFRKKVGSDYYYGCIKLNLSADANTLTLKLVAYCNVANKTFYFGDY